MITCQSVRGKNVDGRRISVPLAKQNIVEGEEQIDTQIINDVDALMYCLPARKSCCSRHKDGSVVVSWSHAYIDCYEPLHVMPFQRCRSSSCRLSPLQDRLHTLPIKPLMRPSSPSCSSSARPSS